MGACLRKQRLWETAYSAGGSLKPTAYTLGIQCNLAVELASVKCIQASQCLCLANEELAAAAGMLAGGTGVTPMYQVAKAILKNKSDR